MDDRLRRLLADAEMMLSDLRVIIDETYESRNSALVAGVHGDAEAAETARRLSVRLAHVTMAAQSMAHVTECIGAAAYPDD